MTVFPTRLQGGVHFEAARSDSSSNAKPRAQLLDGGLSTTLEETGSDLDSALWSSRLLATDPERIGEVHRAFDRAGSDVILTATYQAYEQGFIDAGHNNARELMRSAVHLAADAVDPSKLIALSLGSYGATVKPSAEYSGRFDNSYALDEPNSVAALAAWHRNRLLIFAEDDATWSLIDFVAFETIPLLTEVIAVRQAMRSLNKPFSIATVWPDGVLPHALRDPTAETGVAAFVSTALHGELPAPFAIGMNCTKLEHIEALASQLVTHLDGHFLLLKPDGGAQYDVTTRTWTGGEQSVEAWATQLARLAKLSPRVLIGGCCKSRPEHIAILSSKLES